MAGAIGQLPFADAFSSSSTIAISVSGRDYQINGADFLTWIQEAMGSPEFTVQNAAPSATGFTVTVSGTLGNVWLCINPAAGYAAGTIVLPAPDDLVDGREIVVTCTQAVTTLTVNGNGAADVLGEPTTLAANGFFRMRYQATPQTWYRVG